MANEWARVRVSFVLSFLACLALLPAGAYVGYLAATRIAFRYEQWKSLGALPRQDAQQLRRLGETAYALNASYVVLLSKTKASFERNISVLQQLRPKAVPELWPIIDLQVAEDHATLARLEQEANGPVQAADHRRIAQDMLGSLGWQDVSDTVLEEIADNQLRSRLAKESRK